MSANNVCDVLIVEDDPVQCSEMSAFLARSGLAIFTAQDGWSARRGAAALRPRVVLIDFDLPDTTGLRLAEELRKILPEAAILMMSGRIDGLSENALGKIGITAFLNKPVPLGMLRRAVLQLAAMPPGPLPSSARGGKAGWLSAGLGGTRH
jgi:DNA-binding response OmpR family regulator